MSQLFMQRPGGLLVLLLFVTVGCSRSATPSITLATTTSLQDSGLLDVLVPKFLAQSGIEVKVVAVGTGQALELARRGDADVLSVHDPAEEEKFMAEGHGLERRPIMYNDFVLVGPPSDPAGVKGRASIVEAFTRIAQTGSRFVSRGDESGTHAREKAVWRLATVDPKGDWYIRAGAGMGHVLRLANEKRAYTLSDRGTYLALRQGLDLAVLTEGDPLLINQYSVIVVNSAKHPHVKPQAARQFADFLLSPKTQQTIAAFGVDRHGQPLFFPGKKAAP
jgi:tungstate transport system substrate-binding protein